MKKSLLFLFIFLSIFGLDQLTKMWVKSELPLLGTGSFKFPYGGIPLFSSFYGVEGSIVYATNTGAAWSLFKDFPLFLLGTRFFLLGALLFFFLTQKDLKTRLATLSILAGAFSNIVDTLKWGNVIDLFFFVFFGYPFPVFNIADSAITLGVILFIFLPKSTSPSIKASRSL